MEKETEEIFIFKPEGINYALYTEEEKEKRNKLFSFENKSDVPILKKENFPKLNKLEKLFLKYQSSKLEMGYGKLMQKHLPKKANSMLEIGVWKGAGIRSFQEYYKSLDAYGLNYIFGGIDMPPISIFNDWGITCFEGYQEDVDFLNSIKNQFDIILDDGSHHSDSQIVTFKQMFLKNLEKGGVYVMEDMHCCKEKYWWRQTKSFDDTFLGIMKTIQNGGTFESQFFTEKESIMFMSLIKKIEFPNDSIAFIYKK